MKKLIAALLILATVFALASCGGTKPAEDSKPADTVTAILNAIDSNMDRNGNVTIPVEVLEDAIQQIGKL